MFMAVAKTKRQRDKEQNSSYVHVPVHSEMMTMLCAAFVMKPRNASTDGSDVSQGPNSV